MKKISFVSLFVCVFFVQDMCAVKKCQTEGNEKERRGKEKRGSLFSYDGIRFICRLKKKELKKQESKRKKKQQKALERGKKTENEVNSQGDIQGGICNGDPQGSDGFDVALLLNADKEDVYQEEERQDKERQKKIFFPKKKENIPSD